MSLLDRVQKKAGEDNAPKPGVSTPSNTPPAPNNGNGNNPASARPVDGASRPAVQIPRPATPGTTSAPSMRPSTPGTNGSPRSPQSTIISRSALPKVGVVKGGGLSVQHQELRKRVKERLVDDLRDSQDSTNPDLVAKKIAELLDEVAREMSIVLPKLDRNRLIQTISNEVIGLGPLEILLNDEDVTEIMINSHRQIYVEKKGKLTLSESTFETNAQLMQVIDRIVSSIGRRIDESSPMVDARLKDGSRVNVIIPPLALKGPTMTIRKFAKEALTIEDLEKYGSVSHDMVEFLRSCVRGRLNIVVSGGTGSGKTTTLNILSGFIPDDERIVTIEDAAELQLRQEHVVSLETRPANVEGKGKVTIRDLVINSLRMRPDRIVVGECRGGEALDMLQAMNTGHDGSLTTAHANTPNDCISRLETMVLMAGTDLPSRAIREQIAGAVHVIVQQSRLRDGSRKITNVTEVLGIENEKVKLQDIFVFRQYGIDDDGKVVGHHTPTGTEPHYLQHLREYGEEVDSTMFKRVVADEA